ncbi:hypothetical protein U0070_003969 [Myodes glareolus]|uniref:Uncharacterized protein n=1 Tax=Myodes glareolus TaxID=447135 RepID=A0AAW0K9G7_MYOGA
MRVVRLQSGDSAPICRSYRSAGLYRERQENQGADNQNDFFCGGAETSRDMSSAPTTPPSVDKVDGFSRKSVRKARQKRSQSSSQFRSQGKPIELTPLPLLKGKAPEQVTVHTLLLGQCLQSSSYLLTSGV